MSGATLPPVIPEPFANGATVGSAPGNRTDPIPDTVGTPQQVGWHLGFQAITMQPVAGGGLPPLGQNINGVLFALSAHDFYVQSGKPFPFQAAVATAIGGYAVGTILGSTDGVTVWFNTVDANSTDPDSGGAVGWVSLFAYGYTTKAGLTGGNVVLTPQEAGKKLLVLTGTLSSNLTVILPNVYGRWLVVNATTGAFNTTIRTAGGSGATVPQGGFGNPLEVYTAGSPTINTYPTVAPLGVPIDQAATPLTIAERTNAGYILATYFNQSSSSAENPPVGSVFVESGGDGYLRKATLAYLESVMNLAALGGQIQPSQIVAAAVTQFASLILASAPLTGVPTAPTAALGTANSQVASTAFVNPGSSLATTGYRKMPDGSIEQWGTLALGDISSPVHGVISFPTPFPTACFNVVVSPTDLNTGNFSDGVTWYSMTFGWNTAGFTYGAREAVSSIQNAVLSWRAVGN